jgi:hypothetical protein
MLRMLARQLARRSCLFSLQDCHDLTSRLYKLPYDKQLDKLDDERLKNAVS